MRDHEAAMLAYVRLADVSLRKRQPLGRDKFLVLAAAAACRAGWPEVAERCRALVLEHNHAHLIGKFATVADALRGEEFAPLVKQHERLCSYERAEFLLNDLGLETPAAADAAEKSAGQIALDYLSSKS
jgi:hypothetical protein